MIGLEPASAVPAQLRGVAGKLTPAADVLVTFSYDGA
jgi:hypothetical protein